MNPFLNPITGIPILKNYLLDPGRLARINHKQMKKYQDNALRKIVRYAYNVPVYNKKYKEAGVRPEDIRGIEDIIKLPFITKKDIIENFPDGIVPVGYNKEKGHVVSTSGSSGKPVSIYTDFPTMAKALCLFFRQTRALNFNWRKLKCVNIGTFNLGRIDHAVETGLVSKAGFFYSSDKSLTLDISSPMKDIIKQLDVFKPDMILTYPIVFRYLAYLKKNGYGENINPKFLSVGGYVLDEQTRSYVEDAFGCKMLNIYASVESATHIAFECLDHIWHINSDFFHLEAVDENMNLVAPEEKGHVVITRMFGRGTPIIRYTGMDDWITLRSEYKCSCGLCTSIIDGGVEGRVSSGIVFPDGRVIPAASFALVSLILNDLKTYKVKQFQIIQKKIDKIDILLSIDEDMRGVGPSVDIIFKKIEEAYRKTVGPKVKITVKEVKEIKSSKDKPVPLVISHVKPEEVYKVLMGE